jgi:hypothetical protein
MRLGLLEEVVGQLKNGCSTTSSFFKLEFDLAEELPSVEEAQDFGGCFEGFGPF